MSSSDVAQPLGLGGQWSPKAAARARARARGVDRTAGPAATASLVGVWEWDLSTDRVLLDPVARLLMGLPVSTTEPRIGAWGEFVEPEDAGDVRPVIDRARAVGGEVAFAHCSRCSGRERWLRAQGVTIRDDAGTPIRVVGSLRRVSSDAADAPVVETPDVASTIAHELRQPLTAISTYAAACILAVRQEGREPASIERTLQKIHAQAHRANEILRALRLLGDPGEPPNEAVSALPLARQSADDLADAALGAGVRVTVVGDEPGPRLSGEAVQIRQAVTNLIRNAVEAFDGGPGEQRVTALVGRADTPTVLAALPPAIRPEPSAALAVIAVIDTGPGIPDEMLAAARRLFVTTKPAGMGLGLPIVQSIAEAHGGEFRLARGERSGTVAALLLPIHQTESATHEPGNRVHRR